LFLQSGKERIATVGCGAPETNGVHDRRRNHDEDSDASQPERHRLEAISVS
jgi:hypothetical protein